MKKLNLRLIIFTFLATASIVSYTYLNQMSTQEPETLPLFQPAEEEVPESEIFMPDVEMIKKVIDAGKRLSAFGS